MSARSSCIERKISVIFERAAADDRIVVSADTDFGRATRRPHRAEAFGDPVSRSGKPQARRASAHDSLESFATDRIARERQHRHVRAVARASASATDQCDIRRRLNNSPSGTARHDASPHNRPQKRPHEISDAANCSENSTSKATPSLPWAQGVAGSNPVAPTKILNVFTRL